MTTAGGTACGMAGRRRALCRADVTGARHGALPRKPVPLGDPDRRRVVLFGNDHYRGRQFTPGPRRTTLVMIGVALAALPNSSPSSCRRVRPARTCSSSRVISSTASGGPGAARRSTSGKGSPCAFASSSAAHRLFSYRVSTTPPGNVRVSTRFRFTQLSSAVKNRVPPPTRTG
jgi:hypothetical protein